MSNRPYICGPLTELTPQIREAVKEFYTRLADLCERILGVRAFVPHEHYDPITHAHFTPQDVDQAERHLVCKETSLLIVVAIEPTWGGGIEVEMAHRSDVPVIIVQPSYKTVSRLLRGNPAVRHIIEYSDFHDAECQLEARLAEMAAIRA